MVSSVSPYVPVQGRAAWHWPSVLRYDLSGPTSPWFSMWAVHDKSPVLPHPKPCLFVISQKHILNDSMHSKFTHYGLHVDSFGLFCERKKHKRGNVVIIHTNIDHLGFQPRKQILKQTIEHATSSHQSANPSMRAMMGDVKVLVRWISPLVLLSVSFAVFHCCAVKKRRGILGTSPTKCSINNGLKLDWNVLKQRLENQENVENHPGTQLKS